MDEKTEQTGFVTAEEAIQELLDRIGDLLNVEGDDDTQDAQDAADASAASIAAAFGLRYGE